MMKLLFLTTLNSAIDKEHVFTRNVWKGLCQQFDKEGKGDELVLASVFLDVNSCESFISESTYDGKHYYQLHLSPSLSEEATIAEITRLFQHIQPSIIHSNMVESYDVAAARACGIPIIVTIHIGRFVCPRSGGNGLLKYNDTICDTPIGKHCFKCCSQDFPLPWFSRLLYKLTPSKLKEWAYHKLKGKQIFYLTQFLVRSHDVVQRQKAVEIYKYATVIAANHRLKEILALNGLTDNVVLLPHGVHPRPKLLLPEIREKVKFYFLGRIQYGKGLHNLLQAFEGINNSLYELHVIGDAESRRSLQAYKARVIDMAKGKNVIFHGEIPNTDLESIIKDMHVMIHPGNVMEVYGLTIAESLSIGRPVLATRCGGAEMQVQDGVNGWLVAPNDVVALHNKIEEIIQHKEQIAPMSEHCTLPHPLPDYIDQLMLLYKSKLNQ